MARPKTLPYEAPEQEGPYFVELHSTAGGSDKLYQLSVEAQGGGWVVNYANGRRGGTMATGSKTTTPVAYAEARKICNAKLFEQVPKGYLPIGGSHFGAGHKAEAIATLERSSSGHIPQLCLAVEDDEFERLIRDDRYGAETKHNGERRILVVDAGAGRGGNRNGQTVALSAPLREAVAGLPDLVLDGEQIADTFHFWDILSYRGRDLRSLTLDQRQAALDAGDFERPGRLVRTRTARGEAEKRRLVAQVRAASGEGIVFKRLDAPYDPGKPGGQATWRKFKFWHSLSAIVVGGKKGRSVSLQLLADDGTPVPIGAVKVPENQPMPEPGDVAEIRYLYAFEGGGLHQPVYECARRDIPVSECLASQRSYKPVPAELAVDPVEEAEEEVAAFAP